MDQEVIYKVMHAALTAVSQSDIFSKENELANEGIVHSKRSSQFIEALHEALVPYYSGDNYYVLSKTKRSAIFNRSEFLFDVTVVKMKEVPSLFSNRQVKVITDAVLEVESEFALDLNQTMIDFSKLLCGLSPVKLMVMPLYKNDLVINDWLEQHVFTNEMRKADTSIYYLAYIQHPKHWLQNEVPHFELYKCEHQKIESIH